MNNLARSPFFRGFEFRMKPKKGKAWLRVAVAALLVGAVVGGVFAYRAYMEEDEPAVVVQPVAPTPTATEPFVPPVSLPSTGNAGLAGVTDGGP